jgi:hypothetical protein
MEIRVRTLRGCLIWIAVAVIAALALGSWVMSNWPIPS